MPLDIRPVILAGGMGTRLWPLTSARRPKPFLRVASPYSLLQEALLRLKGFGAPVVVCHADHQARAEAACGEIGVRGYSLVCEPAHRNTAMAVAMAAFSLEGQDCAMLVMPSDHILPDAIAFREAVQKAAETLGEYDIVMLGVRAWWPATRFGYILCAPGGRAIKSFTEKPDFETARGLVSRGAFWNTGIFLCRPKTYLSLLEAANAQQHKRAQTAFLTKKADGRAIYPDFREYVNSMSISVDYAVMEGARSMALVPLESRWRDVGCRLSLAMVWLERLGEKLLDRAGIWISSRRGGRA